MQMLARNRKAYYDYAISEEYKAGIMLTGNEVKSTRNGNVNFTDSFIYLNKGEVWLKNLTISKYSQMHKCDTHEDNRDKKLLLNKKEIERIGKFLFDKGTVCVPLAVLVENNKIKIKIGLGRGKKQYDKRISIKERDLDREMRRT